MQLIVGTLMLYISLNVQRLMDDVRLASVWLGMTTLMDERSRAIMLEN